MLLVPANGSGGGGGVENGHNDHNENGHNDHNENGHNDDNAGSTPPLNRSISSEIMLRSSSSSSPSPSPSPSMKDILYRDVHNDIYRDLLNFQGHHHDFGSASSSSLVDDMLVFAAHVSNVDNMLSITVTDCDESGLSQVFDGQQPSGADSSLPGQSLPCDLDAME